MALEPVSWWELHPPHEGQEARAHCALGLDGAETRGEDLQADGTGSNRWLRCAGGQVAPSGRATIADVAAASGGGVGTVSRGINGAANVRGSARPAVPSVSKEPCSLAGD